MRRLCLLTAQGCPSRVNPCDACVAPMATLAGCLLAGLFPRIRIFHRKRLRPCGRRS